MLEMLQECMRVQVGLARTAFDLLYIDLVDLESRLEAGSAGRTACSASFNVNGQ